jgi:arylsulfatase A-like enzyme
VIVFWLAFWLAVLGFICKASYFGLPEEWTWRHTIGQLKLAAAASGADTLFAVVLGLLLWGTTRLLRRRWVVGLAIGIVALAAFYAIVSARVFLYTRTPMTWTLLYMAGDVASAKSSVLHYATPLIVGLLILGPLACVAAAWASARWLTPLLPSRRWRQGAVATALLLSLAWGWWARGQVNAWVGARDDRKIGFNPHYAMLASLVSQALGLGERHHLGHDFPPEFTADFATVGQRTAATQPTAGIPRGVRNVIVVVGESVGAQNIDLYGSPFESWPILRREAAHALVFENHYAPIANTANSLISLMLSIYSQPLDWRELTLERPAVRGTTPADVLRPRGYRTAFISAADNQFANQIGFLQNRGFDTIWDWRDSGCPMRTDSTWGVEDRCMVDMVLRYIDQGPGRSAQPFLIYAWTQGNHHPYAPYPGQPEYQFPIDRAQWGDGWWDLGRYLNALREMDVQIGRLLDGLRQRGLADDTLVVITGDHGEAFGWPHGNYGHSGKIYQEDVHVPLLLWNPKLFHSAGRSGVIGGHVDLPPTILDILGLPPPADWQGHSLLAPDRPNRAYFYGVLSDRLLGVREGPLKYIYNATEALESLYDLAADPLEKTNLAPQRPADAQRLRRRLQAWVDSQRRVLADR